MGSGVTNLMRNVRGPAARWVHQHEGDGPHTPYVNPGRDWARATNPKGARITEEALAAALLRRLNGGGDE